MFLVAYRPPNPVDGVQIPDALPKFKLTNDAFPRKVEISREDRTHVISNTSARLDHASLGDQGGVTPFGAGFY